MEVLTLVHGREAHLANLIAGLERSSLLPERLIIVQMNQSVRGWQSEKFPILNCPIRATNGRLPLASSRNLATRVALGNQLVFLDVDCIPSADLLSRYKGALAIEPSAILQGVVKYLPPTELDGWRECDLDTLSARHEAFDSFFPGDTLPYHLFWSLNFACDRHIFERVGGFDEAYSGYGGEDTDFAWRARQRDVKIKLLNAKAFHQYHSTSSPPLNYFSDIVNNARLFHTRWGWWPMTDWLKAFEAAGLIAIDTDSLDVLRAPTHAQIEAAKSSA